MKKLFTLLCLVVFSLLPQQAKADDWGCTVLLCLASPSDPMKIAECVSPLKRLWKALSKWDPDPFPSCDMASGPNGRSYGQVNSSYYDSCPSSTSALSYGSLAFQGSAADIAAYNTAQTNYGATADPFANATPYAGIGEQGEGIPYDVLSGNYTIPGAKVCVGAPLGAVTIYQQSSSDGMSFNQVAIPVAVYDRVTLLDRFASPRQVDIFVNDQLAKTVRY